MKEIIFKCIKNNLNKYSTLQSQIYVNFSQAFAKMADHVDFCRMKVMSAHVYRGLQETIARQVRTIHFI